MSIELELANTFRNETTPSSADGGTKRIQHNNDSHDSHDSSKSWPLPVPVPVSACRKIFIIGGCFLVSSLACGIESLGNLTPYLASYLTQYQMRVQPTQRPTHANTNAYACTSHVSQLYSQNIVYCNVFFSLGIIVQSLALIAALELQRRCNLKTRVIAFMAGAFICAGYFGAFLVLLFSAGGGDILALGYSYTTVVVLLSITLGVCNGIGYGLSYLPAITVGLELFPSRQSFITGVIELGTTASPVAFFYIQTLFINPLNIAPSSAALLSSSSSSSSTSVATGAFPALVSTGHCGYVFHTNVLSNTMYCMALIAGVFALMTMVAMILITDKSDGKRQKQPRRQQRHTSAHNDDHESSQLLFTERTMNYKTNHKNVNESSAQSYSYSYSYSHSHPSTRAYSASATKTLQNISKHKKRKRKRKNKHHRSDDRDGNEGRHRQTSSSDTGTTTKTETDSLTLSEALRTLQFWQLFAVSSLNVMADTFIMSEWKVIGQQYVGIYNDTLLTTIGSIAVLLAAFAQIGCGAIMDYNRSFAKTMGSVLFLCAVLFGTLFVCRYCVLAVNVMFGSVLYGVWLFAVLTCVAACYAVLPMTCILTFGQRNADQILSYVFTGEVIAIMLQMLIFALLPNQWLYLSLTMMAIVLAAMLSSVSYNTTHIKYLSCCDRSYCCFL